MNHGWLSGVVMLTVCGAWASARLGQRVPPRDAALASSRGKTVQLKTLFGLPTVLFYEDRHSTALNQPTKDALFMHGQREGLLRAVKVVAVADLEGYNWFPARDFALAAVRDAEAKAGVPILVDWRGVLRAPPWSLPAETSTVLLLDAQGGVVFARSGSLNETDQADLFNTLRAMLAVKPPEVSPADPAKAR